MSRDHMMPEDVRGFDQDRDDYLQNQADLANDCAVSNRDAAFSEMLAALKDIVVGADMMLQLPGNNSYAREVKRVAQAAVSYAEAFTAQSKDTKK